MDPGFLSRVRVILTGLLAVVCAVALAATPQPKYEAETRAGMIAVMRAAFEGLDTDRDSRVTRAEWNVSVEAAMALRLSDPVPLGNPEELRRGWQRAFDVDDTDRDGYRTQAEMLALPLATFTCMDADADDMLTQNEVFDGMTTCEHLAIRMP